MANDLNRCEFIGRLGRDPEIRYMPDGKAIASFSVATGQTWRDKNTGEKREKTEWVPISAFGKLAEIIGEYITKGSQVYVSGRFQTREYEKDGQKHYRTEIIADTMQMLGGKSDKPGGETSRPNGGQGSAARPAQDDDFDQDIPF